MKKSFALISVAAVVLALLPGCSTGRSSAGAPPPSPGEKPLKVGIVQLTDNESFTDMREGFIERMRELGYTEDRMTFDCRDAGNDMATLNTLCQSLIDEKVDLLVPLVTSAAQAAVNLESDIPIVFISVTDPVTAGLMSSKEKPDKNATGTSNLVPVNLLFDLAEELTPGVKTYGILYNAGLINSVLTVKKAEAYLDSIGVKYIERVIINSAEIQQAAQDLADQADAIYVPIDSTILAAMPQVAEAAKEAKLPVYGSAPSMVSYGALATVSVSERETGRQSADLADKYFKGTPISEIPVVTVDAYLTVINKATAEAIGVQIPENLSKTAVLIGE